jgi:hypothetical protein
MKPVLPATLRFTDANVIKDAIDSAEYLKRCIPIYVDDKERSELKEKAEFLYEELRQERLRTYGTDDLLGKSALFPLKKLRVLIIGNRMPEAETARLY